MTDTLNSFQKLIDILDELRIKCPWDRKQTMESLRNLTIEETYELADSILKQDSKEIKKELGDLLLHIVFYAKIASEKNEFTLQDVIDGLCEKLIYRHPHVFADGEAKDATEVEKNWEQLKLKEKNGNKSVLDGVPVAMPAMIKAQRIQDKARGVGFDWEEKEQVWEKVREELAELEYEIENDNRTKIENEFGDFMFSMINAARLYDIDPETALEKTNQKFIRRFNYLESKTIANGMQLKDMSLDEMDILWNEAKQNGL